MIMQLGIPVKEANAARQTLRCRKYLVNQVKHQAGLELLKLLVCFAPIRGGNRTLKSHKPTITNDNDPRFDYS
jgi:hypothetical protein